MRLQPGILGGLLLALGSAQFLCAMMLGETIAPGYSMHDNAISDLGTIPSTRILFNASLATFGVLNVAAGYLLFQARRSRAVFAMFLFGGAGAVGASLVPLDSPLGLHGVFALLAFVFVNLEVIVVGWRALDPFRWVSLGAGAVGLAFSGLMVLVDSGLLDVSGSIGHGGVERLIVYPAMIWMLLYGGRSLASLREGRPEPAPRQMPT